MIRSSGWYTLNWNPVIGCRHACEYCYAKPYAERRAWVEDFTEPVFSETELAEPYKLKKSEKIFVCAYADLFGAWVPREWIERVLRVIAETPQHTYVLLTKNARRYAEFTYAPNTYVGVTIESRDKMHRAEALRDIDAKKFCSIEPILSDFTDVDLSMFDAVVVGFEIYKRTTLTDRKNAASVKHDNLYKIVRR